MQPRPDSIPAFLDSAQAADFARWRAAGYEPVPLRVTELRTIPPPWIFWPLAGALTLGLVLGGAFGYWWRGRRR